MGGRNHLHSQRRAALKRGACVAAAAGGLLVGLSTTASSAATRAHTSSTVTLKFWNAYNTTDKEASTIANVIIPKFEKENPGIKVDSVVIPYSDLLTKFLAAAAAGNPPDLMRSDIAWVPQLASEGVLADLSGQKWFEQLAKGALPGPLSTNKYQGSYYGIPDDTNTQAMFWNKALFAQAGLSGPPTTLAQMFRDAAKLTNKAKGQYGMCVDGTDIWNVSPWVWSNGGSFTNNGLTSATGHMDGHATQSALQRLINLYNAGDICPAFAGGAGATSGEAGFPENQDAFYISGPWMASTYNALKPKPDYGIALFPKGHHGSVSVVGGEDIVLAKGGKNPADSAKFAEFLASPFAQLAMAKQGDMAAYKTDAAGEVAATPYYKVFAEQLQTAKARPVTSAYTKLDGFFSSSLQQAIDGKLSLSTALAAAAEQTNQALAAAGH